MLKQSASLFIFLLLAHLPTAAPCLGAGNQATCEWTPGYHPMGPGGTVQASIVFDDGNGPALYVGGSINAVDNQRASYVARWNGSRWSPLSSQPNNPVGAFVVFDDGTGPALYAGLDNGTSSSDPSARRPR